jgi:uncharacterized protein (TIGR00159 family)
MNLFAIISNLRFRDVLDILFLAIVAYHLYLWFRGTKALKALVGLIVLGIVFTVARSWGLFLTTWVFQIFWQVLIILLIILFQSEIRQVLERVNPLKAIGFQKFSDTGEWVPLFAEAVMGLSEKKIGALIIIERADQVDEFITGGRILNGDPVPEILKSVFQKESPLHDGAMVIRNGQVALVACYLPLSSSEKLPNEWGTRHRAALGLSEVCDAWVVTVSEERGDVSIAHDGDVAIAGNRMKLERLVHAAIAPLRPQRITWTERFHSALTNQWHSKLGSLALIAFFWLLLAGQQDFEVNLRLPVEMRNVPKDMIIVKPLDPEVKVTVRGLRKDASTLSNKNVQVALDLSSAVSGKQMFNITRDQIFLPNDRAQIVKTEPSRLEFEFAKTP